VILLASVVLAAGLGPVGSMTITGTLVPSVELSMHDEPSHSMRLVSVRVECVHCIPYELHESQSLVPVGSVLLADERARVDIIRPIATVAYE
jgi:hypothetical protein